jgi:hypothetical protein
MRSFLFKIFERSSIHGVLSAELRVVDVGGQEMLDPEWRVLHILTSTFSHALTCTSARAVSGYNHEYTARVSTLLVVSQVLHDYAAFKDNPTSSDIFH